MNSAKNEVAFPVFRKYPHEKTFFKVISFTEFEELLIVGGKYIIHNIIAKIHPDRVYIHDLIFNYEPYYVSITEKEYNEIKEKFVEKEV